MSGSRFEPTLDNGMVYTSSMINRDFNVYVDVNYGEHQERAVFIIWITVIFIHKHQEMAVFIIWITVIFLRYIVRKKCQQRTFPTPLPTINTGAYRLSTGGDRRDPMSIDDQSDEKFWLGMNDFFVKKCIIYIMSFCVHAIPYYIQCTLNQLHKFVFLN